MVFKFFLPLGLYAVVASWLLPTLSSPPMMQNHAPKVTITSPAKTSKFQWSAVIPYSIAVADQEDGKTEYDEIANQEVFLSVRYLADSVDVKKYLQLGSRTSQEVLFSISTTTCFNCHQVKTKLIGPSFESIARKYPDNEASVKMLVGKVLSGTSGTWGDVQMPPHPDLKAERVEAIVRWILKNGADPDQNHFVGVEGAFRTRERPVSNPGKAVYVLTATYTDHGENGAVASRKLGQHTVILKSKP